MMPTQMMSLHSFFYLMGKGIMFLPFLLCLLAGFALSSPQNPTVKGEVELVGYVTDPSFIRDSCGSARFNNRALWACRDSQYVGPDNLPTFPLLTSTASWTEFNSEGKPDLQVSAGSNESQLLAYGNNHDRSFYPILYDECNDNQAGQCGDQSRYALWPDSPPMVVLTNPDGSVLAYTWIKKSHIMPDLSSLSSNVATTLYRVHYLPTRDGPKGLPQVEVVNETFWGENEIPFGNYGNVVKDGTAYLWGQVNGSVSLARVGALHVEEIWEYEYWVNGNWTKEQPMRNTLGVNIPNASAGGQGTFYWSDTWQSYVWIGQTSGSVSADFYITTAPEPQGPWIEPRQFHSAQNGNYSLGGYSLQAHPALIKPWDNDIYLTYTKTDVLDGKALYSHPLLHVQWE